VDDHGGRNAKGALDPKWNQRVCVTGAVQYAWVCVSDWNNAWGVDADKAETFGDVDAFTGKFFRNAIGAVYATFD
jgi:hypothetical protein